MDRFIPCRTKENLQAKFEAASQNQSDFWAKKKPLSGGNTGARATLPRQQHELS